MKQSKVRHVAALAAAALVTTGAVGVVAATTATPAAAADASIRVITHNTQKKVGAVDAAFAEARATTGPEVILLQEVCAGMVDGIKARMGTAVYRERKAVNTNCGGAGIGEMAVWTGGNVLGTSKHDLGGLQTGGHIYGLACVTFSHAGRATRACSTHLAAGGTEFDPVRQETARAIQDKSNTWIGEGKRVIVGGDFNSQPGDATMNAMYGVGPLSGGPFREIHQTRGADNQDRGGLNTFYSKKIDYVFISKVDASSSGGTENVCKDCTPSDHRVLWGSLPLKARG
ncbi:hypothetical protein Q9R29_10230 [Rothia sp. ARF10]|nr:hypothetical protein [Rothia sp. ARF10]